MKVRWLLVASLFMAMFAFMSASSVSAAPGVVTEYKIGLTSTGPYPFVHGVADYKVRAGGGSSLAVSIQGAQALRFQKLYVFVDAAGQPVVLTCTLHIGPNGNGSCYIDTRYGEIVPIITPEGGSEVLVYTVNDTSNAPDVAYGKF